MARTTRATLALDRAGVPYDVHVYDYDPGAERIGLQAAESLGVPAACVLKTLMAQVDGRTLCVLIPSDRELGLKKLAAAVGGKAAGMLRPADAARATGYHVGGISPFGQRRRVRVLLDRSALANAAVFVNGGQRGVQIRLSPHALVEALGAEPADLT